MPVMTTPIRESVAAQVEVLGGMVNDLRNRANDAKFGFVCGLLRAAEEAMKAAMETLRDPNASETDL